jgi:citrate lyase subunit beta/citryl-CoA lyase|tara:strand:+ start:84 stop:911 length:828 start_codon:yes stop_codon:yes gene_type:complete
MPAANERALEKAKNLEADALIFDLEDAVSPKNKELARDQACAAASSSEYGNRELTIRCNGLDTPWGTDDVLAAAAAAPAAVVIPKVDGPDYLDQVSTLLDKGGAPPSTRIWAMVETPSGILKVDQIAGHERIAVMVMGTNDMAKELRATITPNRHALLPYLAKCLLSARAADIGILDGVYNDIKDETGFSSVCLQGAQMGFDGKTLIHPNQVAPTNKIFSPSLDELDFHRQVIEEFEAAEKDGRGVLTVNGKMIENLHVDEARRALAIAEAIAAL